MEAKRGWATAVVVIVALAAGVGGGAYLWKESVATGIDGKRREGGLAGDASAAPRAGRAKPKSPRKGARPGKPRVGSTSIGARGGGGGGGGGSGDHAGGGHGGGDLGGGAATAEDPRAEGGEDEVVPEFRPPFRGRGPAGPTYEAAIASNKQEITVGAKGEADLTDAQLHSPMQSGAFVSECGAPDSMKVTVKVAIRSGRTAGVSVATSPPDPDIAGCIDRYVRTFSWPSSSKLDSLTTTY